MDIVIPDTPREGQSLREQLKAEALANAERDLALAQEWFPLEEQVAHRDDG